MNFVRLFTKNILINLDNVIYFALEGKSIRIVSKVGSYNYNYDTEDQADEDFDVLTKQIINKSEKQS